MRNRDRWMLLIVFAVTSLGVAVVVASGGATPSAQTSSAAPMTNGDVIRMVSAKLGDAIVVSAIENAPLKTFDLGVDGLIALKQAGVSDAVIAAMQKAAGAGTRRSAAG